MRLPRFLAMLCLLLFAGTQAVARPFYFGSWTIVSSQSAPWVAPDTSPFPADLAALSGRTITFARQSILGPSLLGCQGPRYVVKRYPPEALFQGNLSDPARQVRALGYRSATIRTLETGCEHLIEYHFIDANEALFALDNRLWRIRRIRR